MNVISGVDVTGFEFVKGETPSTANHYDQSVIKPFALVDAEKCYNLWSKERYDEPLLKKVIPLYATYVRKNSLLIGEGELIGRLAYITGKAYRGMGALGRSFKRTKGIALVMEKGTKLETELSSLGLYNEKKLRYKGLTADLYTLVNRIHTTVYTNGHISRYLGIGFQGNDGSYIDLTSNYGGCITLDFKWLLNWEKINVNIP